MFVIIKSDKQSGSGSIGDNAILGDPRWAGAYGVDADYVADENSKICVFLTEDVKVEICKFIA